MLSVFATLLVCDGAYRISDLHRWSHMVGNTVDKVALVAGNCKIELDGIKIVRVPKGKPSTGNSNSKYRYLHAKFHLWNLPYDRVIYYDLDVLLKPPIEKCASMCPLKSSFCAVRDPVATWPLKSKTYFNGGFFVMTPNRQIAKNLFARGTNNRKFAEQDTLNEYFARKWTKLPKECNWLHYKENNPSAKTDKNVLMVHLGH